MENDRKAQRDKMTPGRFLRRNKPYLILALTLVLIAAAAVFVIRLVHNFSPANRTVPDTPSDTQAAAEPVTPPAAETPVQPDGQPDTPEEGVYVPPFDGTTVLIAGEQLLATYDDTQLRLETTSQLTSFTSLTGQTARIDVQKLNTSIKLLKKDELKRLCIGALQAYYYAAPATDDITVTVTEDTDNCYAAELEAPEYGDASAAAASVRLIELGGALWCVSAIYPEGDDCSAVRQTFDSITVRTADMKLS